MNTESKNEKDLFKIMTFSTSLGFGVLAAFLYSMKDYAHDATLVFSAGTVVAFVVGATCGWLFWRVFRSLTASNRNDETKR